MFSQRAVIRTAQRNLRSPTTRAAFQKRFASHAESTLKGAEDNAFNREREAVKAHAAATSDLWRKLSMYIVPPCLIVAGVNAYILWHEHWAHWAHMAPLEERPEYPYQNIRTKNYFFGNGDKTLFWNDKVNHHKED